MIIRIGLFLAIIFSALLTSPALADEQAPTTKPSALEAVAPYVGGEWRIKATWAGGNALDARATYDWGLAKKFIVAKTFVKTEDGGEYQRYETIFANEDGKLVMYSFTFDGEAHV